MHNQIDYIIIQQCFGHTAIWPKQRHIHRLWYELIGKGAGYRKDKLF